MNTENSKVNESYKLVLNLKQAVGLRSSNEIVALQNFIIVFLLHLGKYKTTVQKQ